MDGFDNNHNDYGNAITDAQKKSPLVIVNIIIAVLCVLNSCLLAIWLSAALGITMPMILIDVLLNILLVKFYRKWRNIRDFQWQKGKRLRTAVIILRISAIMAIIFTFSVPHLLISYDLNYSKPMYQVKRFIYCHGVYTGGISEFLPAKLPKVCEDYKFVTQGSVPAQDYHASSYLIFHTDTATMYELEEDYRRIDGAKLVEINDIPDIEEYREEYGDNYMEYMPEFPKEFPRYVYGRLDDEHIDDFFDAVIYKIPSYYDKGCIFDYSSGLVVYWT